MSKTRQQLRIVAIPTILSLLIHVITYYYFAKSPFPFYNSIKGLDMETIIRFGTSFYNGNRYFSIPNLIIAVNLYINNGTFNIYHHIAFQFFLGILITPLTVSASKLLFRNNKTAFVSGLLAAAYSPALMYECFALKESIYTFFCFLSFVCFVSQLRSQNKAFNFLSGALFICPVFVRDSAIIWILLSLTILIIRKGITSKAIIQQFRKQASFLCGLTLIVCIVFLINLYNCQAILPLSIFNKSYNFKAGSQPNPVSLNLADTKVKPASPLSTKDQVRFLSIIKHYLNKVLLSFKAFEITNNINYYFIRQYFFPLNMLIPPLLLIPLSLSGFLLTLRKKRLIFRAVIVYTYLFSFLLPMWIFLPLSRYKNTLYPVFCIAASYFAVYVITKLKSRKIKPIIYSLLTYCIILVFCIPNTVPVRGSDFFVHGQAIKFKNNDYTPAVGACYSQALRLSPSPKHLIAIINYLFAQKDFTTAQHLLIPFHKKYPKNSNITLNLAISYLATNRPKQAETCLRSVQTKHLEGNSAAYFYNLAEALRLQKKYQQALHYYKISITKPGNEHFKAILSSRIKQLEEKK